MPFDPKNFSLENHNAVFSKMGWQHSDLCLCKRKDITESEGQKLPFKPQEFETPEGEDPKNRFKNINEL